jgi:hypothetical protein
VVERPADDDRMRIAFGERILRREHVYLVAVQQQLSFAMITFSIVESESWCPLPKKTRPIGSMTTRSKSP